VTKVLAFCDYLQEPMGGGAEIVSAEVYRRLASNDVSITVLSGVGAKPVPGQIAGPDVEIQRRRGLDLSKFVGAQASIAPGLVVAAWRAVRQSRPDVIHASSIHFFGSIVAAGVATLSRIPLVTTCHVSQIDALPARTRRVAALYERTLGRFILGRSVQVIAVSKAVADHVISLNVDAKRVAVVENGVDTDRFSPGERDESAVTIAFVGRLIDNKGPLVLMRAFSLLGDANARLVIVGTGPQQDEVEALAAQDSRIEVLGHSDTVPEILAGAHIFVRPSLTEGRSLAVLEAMAAGCAVVATDIAANAELITSDETGILTPAGDVESLAQSLERLIGDPALRLRLGLAGRDRVLSCSWDVTAASTGDVLRQAAGLVRHE